LYAPNEALRDQNGERVVHGLPRDGADLTSHDLRHHVGADVGLTRDGSQDSQSLGGHLNAMLAKEIGLICQNIPLLINLQTKSNVCRQAEVRHRENDWLRVSTIAPGSTIRITLKSGRVLMRTFVAADESESITLNLTGRLPRRVRRSLDALVSDEPNDLVGVTHGQTLTSGRVRHELVTGDELVHELDPLGVYRSAVGTVIGGAVGAGTQVSTVVYRAP
jgi:hypothetical protein